MRETWPGITAERLEGLRGAAPRSERLLSFEASGERAGAERIHGYIVPPRSGLYFFWIESNGRASLRLSPDDAALRSEEIALTPSAAGRPESRSRPRRLQEGERYYIEVLAGEGSTRVTVRWRLPDGTVESPIPAVRLRLPEASPPRIVEVPGTVEGTEGEELDLSVRLAGDAGTSFRWRRDGEDIPDSDAPTLRIRPAWSDNGSLWQVIASNAAGAVTGDVARLALRRDTTPPALVSVSPAGGRGGIAVRFSEPLDPVTATDPGNYSLQPEVDIRHVRLSEAGDEAMLLTSGYLPAVPYRIAVRGVRDRADAPNATGEAAMGTLLWDPEPLPPDRLPERAEPSGPSSRNTALVIGEIHYHPAGDGPEFVEIHNSNPWGIDLDGYRLSGSIGFSFPAGTVIEGQGRLVVSDRPGELAERAGPDRVLGPWTGELPDSSGTVRLHHPAGALLLETEYADRGDWPVAADGFGHSLVLHRPSLGESTASAWSASTLPGGSPGTEEDRPGTDPWAGIRINEFLAASREGIPDYVEIHSYAAGEVSLAGCTLSDRADRTGYTFPDSARLEPGGRLSLDEDALGFGLSASGERIVLRAPGTGQVIDAVRFTGQLPDRPRGRYPDGSPWWARLAFPTPGRPNAPPEAPGIVINEIMYHPPDTGERGEYIELHNATGETVDLSGWRLSGGVRWTFPEGLRIEPRGYLVVARDTAWLGERHAGLSPANLTGGYEGSLSNRGESLVLERREGAIDDPVWVEEDRVVYRDGGRWGTWSDGGGSSLELIDPRSDNRLASSWADSDETDKAPWVELEHVGRISLGRGSANELHVMLLGRGECLVDDLFVAPIDEQNLLTNPDFENGTGDWLIQGNHVRSGWSGKGRGYRSERSLHLRASSGGDNGANRLEADLGRRGLSSRSEVVLRARARWLRGHPDLLLRLKGNGLELSARLPRPANPGTPGAFNSRGRPQAGPRIVSVSHHPILPEAGEDVEVIARVAGDPGSLTLRYRRDRLATYQTLPMTDRGAGLFSALVPGQRRGELIAFHVEAGWGDPGQDATRLPGSGPEGGDGLIRFGDSITESDFGNYRLWIAEDNVDEWSRREQLSNEPLDCTFVYGDFRAIYNAGGRYRGSPWIRPRYRSPESGDATAMVVLLPADDPFLGVDKINLDGLEPGRDPTLQREMASYWIAERMGVPFCHQRHVHFQVNGTTKGRLFADTQHPSSEYIECWFPESPEGELYKIDDWFEFTDSLSREFNVNATLERFPASGPLASTRYRWNWEKKPHRGLDDDHSSLLGLVEALNTPDDRIYAHAVDTLIDADQWMRVFAVRHIVGDWDGYGYDRGKNMWAYRPEGGRWKLLLWDLDFALGANSHGTSASMHAVDDDTIRRMYRHPRFSRIYQRAWKDAIEGPLQSSAMDPRLDRIHEALQRSRISVGSPNTIKSWVAARRRYLERQLDRQESDFALDPSPEIEPEGTAILTGSAPLEVDTIRVNSEPVPLEWTRDRNWRIRLPLQSGEHVYRIEGLDRLGRPVPESTASITLAHPGGEPVALPVINELLPNPALPGAGFVEIHNPSPTRFLDMSGMVLRGMDYRFPSGYVMEPGEHAVIAGDRAAFAALHGESIPVLGVHSGNLAHPRQRLRLLRDAVVADQVTYESRAPWPVESRLHGASLQLVHPLADNRRIAHWSAQVPIPDPIPPDRLVLPMDHLWHYRTDQDEAPPQEWIRPGFDASAWSLGEALFHQGERHPSAPVGTVLDRESSVCRFLSTFPLEGPGHPVPRVRLIAGGATTLWLNGTEVLRPPPSRTGEPESLLLPSGLLRNGENVLAIEVRRTGDTSITFGLELRIERSAPSLHTPGRRNSNFGMPLPLPDLVLNEVGITEVNGVPTPWIEILNVGEETIPLDALHLTSDYRNPLQWAFPPDASLPPGRFGTVWCGTPPSTGDWQSDLVLPLRHGGAGLAWKHAAGTAWVDYLNYPSLSTGRSHGALPDGSDDRGPWLSPTPGAANRSRLSRIPVFLNEWMAANTSSLADPASGRYSDWVELHNAGDRPVDLSGFRLHDNPDSPLIFPMGTLLEARSFMLLWADGSDRPLTGGAGWHLPFRLDRQGESLTLLAPDGTVVDRIEFGEQDPDRSSGRFPDGAPALRSLPASTPGSANTILSGMRPVPVLQSAPERPVDEGLPLVFPLHALHPGGDPTLLRLQLGSVHPPGIELDPLLGILRWTPDEADGPGLHPVEVEARIEGGTGDPVRTTYRFWVNEVNQPPRLVSMTDRIAPSGSELVLQLQASDPDLPPQSLAFRLAAESPPDASLDPSTGLLRWILPEPGIHRFHATVTDDGSPPLSDTASFTVEVVAASPPARILETAGRLHLAWNTLPGTRYRIETTTDLLHAPWTPIEEGDGTGSELSFPIPEDGASARFFRVLTLP